ncbi:MAG TPA: 50S ribosomal protein L25 [Candidatus Dormibacteraeota bacterium]|nr:50S ribosomal protein L25 [Candidatus Dormibacteraeota bacterium]
MSSKDQTLTVEPRAKTGTTSAAGLRAKGMMPAVLYGHGDAPQHLAVERRGFEEMVTRGGLTGILTLVQNGKKLDTALVREIQRHPVTRKIIHADLQRVTAHEAVHAHITIVTIGVPRGVKELGGVMDVLAHHLDVEGPVDALPENFEVDVTELGIHQHVTAGEIALPKGFRLITPPDTILVTVEASKTARQLEETAIAAPQLEPEVVGQKSETKE